MRWVFICRGFLLLLMVAGCDSSWRSRFPVGTKLYDETDHHFFGQVVAFEDSHDFHNGTGPVPAILIEQADAGHTRVWGSCATCAATFSVESAVKH